VTFAMALSARRFIPLFVVCASPLAALPVAGCMAAWSGAGRRSRGCPRRPPPRSRARSSPRCSSRTSACARGSSSAGSTWATFRRRRSAT
jgi:hypothetical protein